MRIVFQIILFATVLFFNSTLYSQELKPNEVVVIKGQKYVLHQVRTGETIYSITRTYKITRSVLKEHNPEVAKGLKIGDVLQIPLQDGVEPEVLMGTQKGDPTGFITHTLKSRKETPYFIAQKYDVTVEDIFTYNPTIRKFKKGIQVRIPVWETKGVEVVPDVAQRDEEVGDKYFTHQVNSGETLYSITRLYGISEAEVLNLNPHASNLQAGMELRIPSAFRLKDSLAKGPVVEEKVEPKEVYFEHIIESGETLWGTARRYQVSEEDLKEINPVLRTGFQAGVVIKIPVSEPSEDKQAGAIDESEFIQHVVVKGETLWGLASRYEWTIPEIEKYNPVLRQRNLLEGETILIPRRPEPIAVSEERESEEEIVFSEPEIKVDKPVVYIPEECRIGASSFMDEEYKIALFLPLYLEANDTLNREYIDLDSIQVDESKLDAVSRNLLAQDTSIERESIEAFKQFYGGSENYIQFYEGILLAMDSMQKVGMNLTLKVYDTQRNADTVRKYVQEEGFLSTDLIIGPVLPSVQKDVAEIAAKNNIPMVSPLASQSKIINHNSNYYQVVPSREYIGRKTAEMVADEFFNSNFIVLKVGEYEGTLEGDIVASIQEKLFNSGFLSQKNGVSFTSYDFRKEGPFGLRRIMSHTKENVVFIPSMNEGELSVGVSNINNLANDYSITLIGSNRYQRYESINIEQYHNLKMRYVSPYWMDYSRKESLDFIEKFKSNFGTEPDNYGVQGYDVAMYFLQALKNFGRDFEACLPYLSIDLLQGNYHFEKVSPFGGYMNTGVPIIYYSRDYEVKKERIEGTPVYVVEEAQEGKEK